MSKFSNPQKIRKHLSNVHKIGGAHYQCVNNHSTDGQTDRRSGPITRSAFANAGKNNMQIEVHTRAISKVLSMAS